MFDRQITLCPEGVLGGSDAGFRLTDAKKDGNGDFPLCKNRKRPVSGALDIWPSGRCGS